MRREESIEESSIEQPVNTQRDKKNEGTGGSAASKPRPVTKYATAGTGGRTPYPIPPYGVPPPVYYPEYDPYGGAQYGSFVGVPMYGTPPYMYGQPQPGFMGGSSWPPMGVYAAPPSGRAWSTSPPPHMPGSWPLMPPSQPWDEFDEYGGGCSSSGGGNTAPAANRALSLPGPPIQLVEDGHGPEGCNLFIFHIPNEVTNQDLFEFFSPFGNVISARIMVDVESGRSRGFGFVSFENPSSADDAIEGMNGLQIGKKRLKVQHKKDKTLSSSDPTYGPDPSARGRGRNHRRPGDHDGSPRGSGPHRNRAHHHHREQFWNASVSAEPAEEPPEDHFEDANADESHSNDDGGASDALNSLSFGDVDDLHDGGETDQVK